MGCKKLQYESKLTLHRGGKSEVDTSLNLSRLPQKSRVDTGYYYYGARYYNPRISNWLSVDPMADEMLDNPKINRGGVYRSMNLNNYNYVSQNPVNITDPNGMCEGENCNSYVYMIGGANLYGLNGSGISDETKQIMNGVNAESVKAYNLLYMFRDNDSNQTNKIAQEIKKQYDSDPENSEIILYGYSKGGKEVMDITRKLDEMDVPVELLITVDAAESKFSDKLDRTVPSNVKKNINYFQTDKKGLLQSRGAENSAVNGSKTKIKNYNNTGLPCSSCSDGNTINHSNIDEANVKNVTRNINNETSN